MQDYPHAPDIRLSSIVLFSSEQFWGSICVASSDRVQALANLSSGTPKVCNLQSELGVNQQVLQLQISMDEMHSVHSLHSEHQVSEEFSGMSFTEGPCSVDEVTQVAMWAVFHHQEHSVAVDNNFVEFDDVRVEESFHCDGLSQDLLVQHHVLATPRPEGFNSHMGSSSHVVRKSDRCKFTLSDGGTEQIRGWDEEVEVVVTS